MSSTVGFCEGFSLPSSERKIKALGRDGKELSKQKEYSAKHHKEIPTPTHQDDWLAQYEEDAQSFPIWHSYWKKLSKGRENKTKLVYLISIETPKTKSKSFQSLRRYQTCPSTTKLKKFVEAFYPGIQVKILPSIKIKEISKSHTKLIALYQSDESEDIWEWDLDARVAHKYDLHRVSKYERQIRVDGLLDILKWILPSDGWCLCGLTMEDLYDGKTDSFVSGMAAGGNHVGVFSFSRYFLNSLDDLTPYEQSVFFPKGKNKNTENINLVLENVLLRRCCKTLVHEIAHLYGIGHCIYYDCCMNGSGHLYEDFQQSMHLCPVDLRKIAHIVGTENLSSHFRNLYYFFSRHDMHGDVTFLQNKLGNDYFTIDISE